MYEHDFDEKFKVCVRCRTNRYAWAMYGVECGRPVPVCSAPDAEPQPIMVDAGAK